jgi:hypothetical protein
MVMVVMEVMVMVVMVTVIAVLVMVMVVMEVMVMVVMVAEVIVVAVMVVVLTAVMVAIGARCSWAQVTGAEMVQMQLILLCSPAGDSLTGSCNFCLSGKHRTVGFSRSRWESGEFAWGARGPARGSVCSGLPVSPDTGLISPST